MLSTFRAGMDHAAAEHLLPVWLSLPIGTIAMVAFTAKPWLLGESSRWRN